MTHLLARLTAHFLVLVTAGTLSFAQDFKQYPGSRFDEKASQQASAVQKGTEVQIYTTADTFEKVYSFYRALYKEAALPWPKQTLPNGKEVKWAFFILDDAKDLVHSNYWMKVQRPYIGTVDDEAKFNDVRETSAIQTVRRRGSEFNKMHLLDVSNRR